ncbi:acetylcholinesterase collagenic tail peptide-like [Lepisosteus oculatus]|uniref:acetylcholinesterase collagenic tail peptide-like n=1 Tax=Lepisosteus oculatus TaxID=7918 RepID=UPI0035F51872
MTSKFAVIITQFFFGYILIHVNHLSASLLITSVNTNGLECCKICIQPPPPPPFPPPSLKWIFMIRNQARQEEVLLHLPSAPMTEHFNGCEDLYLSAVPTADTRLLSIRGPKGEKGQRGQRGSKGLPGQVGLIGPPGLPGSIGPPGQKGEKGNRGWVGISGEKGMRGKIKGQQGQKGAKGQKGIKGKKGTPGEKGSPGYSGPIGYKGGIGPRGNVGLDGSEGPRGIPGKRGLSGINGDSGVPGITGPVGPTGARGPPGRPGSPGPVHIVPGSKGEKGHPGLTEKCTCVQQNIHQPVNNSEYIDISSIYIVNNEEELSHIKPKNVMVLRRDTRTLYVYNEAGWIKVQAYLPDSHQFCGDGVLHSEYGEECDDGNQDESDNCINCLNAFCGDGHRHVGVEECDQLDLGQLTCASYLPGSYGILKCDRYCKIDSTDCRFFRD